MKRLLIALGVLLVLMVGTLAALPYLVNIPQIHAAIAHSAAQALGRPVTFRELSLTVFPLPALRLSDLRVAEDPRFGAAPFLAVESGRMALQLRPLFSGRIEVTELTLERPQLALIQDPGGHWNVASLGGRPGAPSAAPSRGSGAPSGAGSLPLVSRVRVTDGSLRYEARSARGASLQYRLDRLNLAVNGVGLGTRIEFRGETRLAPGDLWIRITNGRLSPAAGQPLAAAALKADLEVRADDVAAVGRALLGPAPALSGPIRGTLALSGTPASPAADGELALSRLRMTEHRPACPEPKTRSLALETIRLPLGYAPSRLTGRPLSLKLGSGTVTAALRLDFAPRPLLRLNEISVKALPLAPLLEEYLCQGYAVRGPLDLRGELAMRPADPWRTLAGEGTLRVGAGRVVGPQALALLGAVVRIGSSLASALSLDLPQQLFTAPLDFDSITASYRIVDGRLTTQDFLYSSQAMTVAASGDYWFGDDRLNMDVSLKSGRHHVRARVTGTSGSPSIRVQPSQRVFERGAESLRRFLRGLPGQPPEGRR